MKIGVFDSGVGGKSIANAIRVALPYVEIVLEEDIKNLPYGTKTKQQLYDLVMPILNKLSKQGCDVIVVACNTVSTTLAKEIKSSIDTPIITIVPMIKPASKLTKSRRVTVCATPATLKSERYAQLKAEFGEGIEFYEPDCSTWATMIQNNKMDILKLQKIITESKKRSSDVIVLGCTHYHWISKTVEKLAGSNIKVIHPEEAVVKYLKKVLRQLD